MAADTIKATTTTTMGHLLNRPTVVLDTTNLHTNPMQGRGRCMATLHTSHNTPIMAAIPSSRMFLNINRNLASIPTGRPSLLVMVRRAVACEEVPQAVVGAAILPTCPGLPVKARKVATSYSLERSLDRETMLLKQRHRRVSSFPPVRQMITTIPSGHLPT